MALQLPQNCLFTNDELQFIHLMSLSHCSSEILLVSDKSIENFIVLFSVIGNATQHDGLYHIVQLQKSRQEYITLQKLIRLNPPLHTNTHVISSTLMDFKNDIMNIYEEDALDVIFLFYDLVDLTVSIPLSWRKLKSNGVLLIKGINKKDVHMLQLVQRCFSNISLPEGIKINISLVEQSSDMLFIKKPVY